IQRLWFPEPGSGGDIPSRSEHGMSAEAFDAAIPNEFWREVVDRVAAEAPDTLLLAEAFWMMEGYFVRSLGMHRVYNSAFMNMLKDEENAKYRQTIKNTIEFDKEILRRFVNFMNNPDEETAVAQFGKGDKYIGVCTLMVTMPGLPMFGHGQVEGFTEKYGMEYRRAYLDERPDRELLARHEAEVFPLSRRRHLFAGVENFLLYDLYTEDGTVNENVFAYSNSCGNEHGLVLYNNAYERGWGWIRSSAGYVERLPGGGKQHRRGELALALGLTPEHGYYCLFRDERSRLWFIRESRELAERGLFVELAGYQSQVFVDFHEVNDDASGHYAQLADELGGRGVPDVEEAIREVALKPLLDLYARIANSSSFFTIQEAMQGRHALEDDLLDRLAGRYRSLLQVGASYQPIRPTSAPDPETAVDEAVASLVKGIRAVERLPFLQLETSQNAPATYRHAVSFYTRAIEERPDRRDLLAAWLVLRPLEATYRSVVGICEQWGLITRAERAFASQERESGWVSLMKVLLAHGNWWERHADSESPLADLAAELFADGDVTIYLGLNEYEGEVWFNRERLEELRWWLFATALVSMDKVPPEDQADRARLIDDVNRLYALVEELEAAARASQYRVEKLLAALGGSGE
ncbi:MAG: alpha-amylase, partial [Spirochaetota bacterium]